MINAHRTETELEALTAEKSAVYKELKPQTDVTTVGAASPVQVLSPTRYPQKTFFIADIDNATIKVDLPSMEHPFFALKAGDQRVRTYERNGSSLTIKPGRDGCATMHDKDLWIFCISQLVKAMNRRREDVSRIVRFTAQDFLLTTKRSTAGTDYKRMIDALERMKGTEVETNIASGGQPERFCLVEAWRRVIQTSGGGRKAIEVTLPDWLYRSVLAKNVLTLSANYFSIRKPMDRRIYELARKHCGNQRQWICTLNTLYEKSGSTDAIRNFRVAINALEKSTAFPDYWIYMIPDDKVMFLRRNVSATYRHFDSCSS
jgi:hypothetical protein